MKVVYIFLVSFLMSCVAIADGSTLFSCYETEISLDNGSYFLNSSLLIDSSKGVTNVVEDSQNRYSIVNKKKKLIPEANATVTLTVLLTINKVSGEGQIMKVDDEGEVSTTYLSGCL